MIEGSSVLDEYDSVALSFQTEKNNLIINYLPHHVGDDGLQAIFNDCGEIVSVKVVRDKSTKKSLGFGFVKFADENSAIEAVRLKNGIMIDNKRLKVSLARPASDDIKNCKLYVTNLPNESSEASVGKLFERFGEIIECRVLNQQHTQPTGIPTSKDVAFVQFATRSQAERALEAMNGVSITAGRVLSIKFAESQQSVQKKKQKPIKPTDVTNNISKSDARNGQNLAVSHGGSSSSYGSESNQKKSREYHDYYSGGQVPDTHSAYYDGSNSSNRGSLPGGSLSSNSALSYVASSKYSTGGSGGGGMDHSQHTSWYSNQGPQPVQYVISQPYSFVYQSNPYSQMSVPLYASARVEHQPSFPAGPGSGPNGRNSNPNHAQHGHNHTMLPPARPSTSWLFLTNLPPYTDRQFIEKLLKSHGTVMTVNLTEEHDPTAPKRATVAMATPGEAQAVTKILNGVILGPDLAPVQVSPL